MQIVAGTRLGPYEIIAPIGAGGMGEVFKARDTRLDRSVAIKVVSREFAERFEREAKSISQLNHPHICTLHDIGHEDGTSFLVMELLEGETLAERIARGPLTLAEVLRFGAQIAGALDRAHRHGIVHRDLKPGNVMLTKSGAKLLDFGLAKDIAAPGQPGVSILQTEKKAITQEGTIVGTFQYMAPEQLEGLEAGPRTDIFALGALLYEMATGRRAFDGKTRTSIIAAIVDRDPTPISQIQPLTPSLFEHVVQKCLEKSPDDRWQSAHDIATELRWIAESEAESAAPGSGQRTRRREQLAWTIAGLLLLGLIAAILWKPKATPPRMTRTEILPPAGADVLVDDRASGSLSISPDGRMITFAAEKDGKEMLWLRNLSEATARPLPFTDGAVFPFWSPDSRQIAFFSEGKLRKIDISGGPAVAVCDAEEGRSGSWNRDGVIIFEPHWRSPIHRVSASGGKSVAITRIDEAAQETTHRWATFLPDGKHFLYLAGSHLSEEESDRNSIYAASLDSPDRKLLLYARSNVVYASGHLLFVRDRFLLAQRFDPETLTLSGDARPIFEGVQYVHGFLRGSFAASEDGTLVYHRAVSDTVSALHWIDRATGVIGAPLLKGGFIQRVAISPDATRAVLEEGAPSDLWLADLERGSRTRLTTHRLNDESPVWSPDGQKIVFGSDRNIDQDLYITNAGDSGSEELVARLEGTGDWPASWSSDGRFIVLERYSGSVSRKDLWVLPVHGDRKLFPYRATQADEKNGFISPDGKWMAFLSDQSGRSEVYVAPFPGPGPATQISTNGAEGISRWRSDGRELLFRTMKSLMSVAMETSPTLTAGTPQEIPNLGNTRDWSSRYLSGDMAADGKRFLAALREGAPPQVPVTLVQNWTEELHR